MNILIPMAGGADAFKEKGLPYIKSLTEVCGEPLVQHVYTNLAPLKADRHIYVIRTEDAARHRLADVLRLMDASAAIVQSENPTRGAACTALLAIQHIDPDRELIITNGDQILAADLPAIVAGFRESKLDGGAIVFDSVHPRWSFVRVDANHRVVEAAEKRPISRWATAGFYYYARGADFVRAAMDMIRKDAHVNGQFYVCPAFNEMILRHAQIGIHAIPREAYISLATPTDVERYEQTLTGRARN